MPLCTVAAALTVAATEARAPLERYSALRGIRPAAEHSVQFVPPLSGVTNPGIMGDQ
jgi:hypothetical protein